MAFRFRSDLLGAAAVSATAGRFRQAAGILAIRAAVFFALFDRTTARRMCAFGDVVHRFSSLGKLLSKNWLQFAVHDRPPLELRIRNSMLRQ
jgi:hypothetical protein